MSRLLAVDVWVGRREDDALQHLPVIFSRALAKSIGLSDRSIYWLRDEGYVVEVARGLYRRRGHRSADLDLAAVAVRAPQATICLTTALSLHGLCDVSLPIMDIALPRGVHRPRGFAAVAWHCFDPATFDIGRGIRQLEGGFTIGLYTAERCLVDALRLRHHEGPHLGVEALKRWTKRKGASTAKLIELARQIPKGEKAVRRGLDVIG